MFGKNKILAPIMGDGQMLEVVQIFPTLQGEGIFVGVPAVFIRLGGCNLACSFCDTQFDDFTQMLLSKIIEQVIELSAKKYNLVVITGGEPFRQNIDPLCEELQKLGFIVQIETNGTLYRELPNEIQIICSPKNISGNYAPIRPDLLSRITAFKFIISAHDKNYQTVPEYANNLPKTSVFVQPMDEGDSAKNAANIKLAIAIAMQRGYRLSLQTHKILGIE